MKYIRYTLIAFSAIFQYIIPVALFGLVVPYYKDTLDSGLTGMGYLVLAILAIVLLGKAKAKLLSYNKGLLRALLLAIFPIATWVILGIGIEAVLVFINSLVEYWWMALVFIVIGNLFGIIEEGLFARESRQKEGKQ